MNSIIIDVFLLYIKLYRHITGLHVVGTALFFSYNLKEFSFFKLELCKSVKGL